MSVPGRAADFRNRSRVEPVTVLAPAVRLAWLVAALSAVATLAGLLAGGGPGRHTVASLHGRATELFGEGLYRNDTLLVAAGTLGTDVATLVLGVPALLYGAHRYRRGSVRGALILVGVLGWTLYYYCSMTFGNAYNRLFPVYVLLFGASAFALPMVLRSIDPVRFALAVPASPSRRLLTGYLCTVAGLLALVWGVPMAAAVVTGRPPDELGTYTSPVTWALDLGLVVPAALTVAVLLHRRAPAARLLAAAMLALNVAIGVALVGQVTAQLLLDVPLTVGEVVGKSLSFVALTGVAGVLLGRMLRRMSLDGGAAGG